MKTTLLALLLSTVSILASAQGFVPVKLNNADLSKRTKSGKVASWSAYNRDWPGNVTVLKDMDGTAYLNVKPTKSPTQKETMAMVGNKTKFSAQNGDTVRVRFLFRLKKMDRAALTSSVVLFSSNGGKYNQWMPSFRTVMKMPVPNVWAKYDKTIVISKQPKAGTFSLNIHVRGKEVDLRDFAVEVKKHPGNK